MLQEHSGLKIELCKNLKETHHCFSTTFKNCTYVLWFKMSADGNSETVMLMLGLQT